jgi:hypothetical protein
LALGRLYSHFPNVAEWLLNEYLSFPDRKRSFGLAAVFWLIAWLG